VEVEEFFSSYRLNYIEASINRCVDKTSHRTIYCVSNSTMESRIGRVLGLPHQFYPAGVRLCTGWTGLCGILGASRLARMPVQISGQTCTDMTRHGQNDRNAKMRRREHYGCYYIACLMLMASSRHKILVDRGKKGVSESKNALRRK